MKKYISDMTCLWLALITIGCQDDIKISDVDATELISKYEQSAGKTPSDESPADENPADETPAVNLKCYDNNDIGVDIGTVTCQQEGGKSYLYVCKPKKSEDNPNEIAKEAVSEKFMECPGGCDGNKCAKTNTQLEQCDANTHLGDVICKADKSAKAKLWACQKEGDNEYKLNEIIECPSGKCDSDGTACVDVSTTCTGDRQKCDNNVLMKCNGEQWIVEQPCELGCMVDKDGNASCIECIDGPIQCDAERVGSDNNIFFKFKATSCKDGKRETEYCGGMCVKNQGCTELSNGMQHCYKGNIYTYRSGKGWEKNLLNANAHQILINVIATLTINVNQKP